jgi:hypothetical protein
VKGKSNYRTLKLDTSHCNQNPSKLYFFQIRFVDEALKPTQRTTNTVSCRTAQLI